MSDYKVTFENKELIQVPVALANTITELDAEFRKINELVTLHNGLISEREMAASVADEYITPAYKGSSKQATRELIVLGLTERINVVAKSVNALMNQFKISFRQMADKL